MKTRMGLAVGAALFLASFTATADDTDDFAAAIGIGWVVSSLGGMVTGIGTAVTVDPGWGYASVVTSIASLAYGTVFVVYAAGPNPCANSTGSIDLCSDPRGALGVLGAVNLTLGAVNALLAAHALSGPPMTNVGIAPLALDDTRGRNVPGVVVMGRF
jgi:hypothetical protein